MKWFKHDADANCDAKLKRVKIKYGMEGYGLYWHCIELIAGGVDQHRVTFELEHDAEIISHDTGIHYERVQEMMEYMVSLGLFENTNGTITCMKLAKRLDKSMTSNPMFREMINNLHNSPDSIMTKSTNNHDEVMTQSPQIRREEIRLDNKKPLSGKPDEPRHQAKEILIFLNEKTSRNYQPVNANLNLVIARLREYPPKILRQVIAKKCREWGTDEKMMEFLRPKTLFAAQNFASYAGEIVEVEDE